MVQLLKENISEQRTVLDQLVSTRSVLAGLVGPEGAQTLEDLLREDQARYGALTTKVETLATDLNITYQQKHDVRSDPLSFL